MKILLTSLLLLITSLAFTQRLYDFSGKLAVRFDNDRVYDTSGKTLGRIDTDRIFDASVYSGRY